MTFLYQKHDDPSLARPPSDSNHSKPTQNEKSTKYTILVFAGPLFTNFSYVQNSVKSFYSKQLSDSLLTLQECYLMLLKQIKRLTKTDLLHDACLNIKALAISFHYIGNDKDDTKLTLSFKLIYKNLQTENPKPLRF